MIKSHQRLDLFGKGVFEKAVLEPPFRLRADMSDEACFYYLVNGEAYVYTPEERVTTTVNEGLVMQCGTYFNEYLPEQMSEPCEAIAIHFYPEVLKALYEKDIPEVLLRVGQVEPLGYRRQKASILLHKYIESLQFYFANPELVSEELLKLKMKEIIILLAQTDNAAGIQDLLGRLFTPREIDFKRTIEAHIFHPLNIEELAALTHLSLSSFKREFKKHYATTPARYIRERRLAQAANLLRTTEFRITSIAYDCGFQDVAHFSKAFRKYYDCPPSIYRFQAMV